MSKNHTLLNLIWQWSNMIDQAKKIKQDPEKRQRTVRFGVLAIFYGLITTACACALLLAQFIGQGILLTVFGVVMAFGIGVVGTLVSFITALIHWFCQLSLNKRPITWISLVFMLISFVAAALIPILFLA